MKETIEEVAETIAKGFGSENWQEIKDGIIRYAVDEKQQENNFFESLQKYFKETPREKVLEDWNKSAHLDNVGPTVEEFVENSNEERFKEAAELYLENVNTKVHKDLERDGWMKIGFISGAKWQQEQDKILNKPKKWKSNK